MSDMWSGGEGQERRARGAPRIVAFFAHPDDEAYAAGGTLALWARRGATVSVVVATRGESGGDVSGQRRSGQSLGELRLEELAESCQILGAGAPRCLELPDGRVEGHDPEDALGRLLEVLEALSPDVVITHGRDGAYGHRDHLACAALTARAWGRLPRARRPRVLHVAFPRGLFAPLRRLLDRFAPSACSPEVTESALGVARAEVELVVDIAPACEAKLRALAAHRSQLPGGDVRRFLTRGLIDRLLAEEWFSLALGPPWPADPADPLAWAPSHGGGR